MKSFAACILLSMSGFGLVSAGAEAGSIRFSRDIIPILSDHCFKCHGPDAAQRKGNLRLDTAEGAYAAGKSGAVAIMPGRKDASELMRRITTADEADRMPPPEDNRPLTEAQIALLGRWIEDGAGWGKHWAYEAPVAPAIPATKHAPANPIDSFIFAKLEQAGLEPAPAAPKETLLRRVTLHLTGLPPTPEEIDALLKDRSPKAYERAVDRLLDSPRYGERMAWDWLDAARYADSNGFQGDPERTMWPWRDWVVDAFNANMPYDRFTIDQLAGDLLPEATREQKLATAFHRNNMLNGEGGRIIEETRVENVFDRVETTATIWLGATFTCTRCHDHKYDPFTQRDYFGWYDIFNQMSENGSSRGGQTPPLLDISTPAEEARLKAANAKFDDVCQQVAAYELEKFPRPEGKPLSEAEAFRDAGNLKGFYAAREPKNRAVDQLLEAINYFKPRDPDYTRVIEKLLAASRERSAAANEVTRAMIMDHMEKPRDTFMLLRGTYDKPFGEKVLGAMPASLPTPQPKPERASRLDLARWVVAPENPLTARVTVNRYWQTFFDTGLVKSVEDFGVQGERPSHPELLDWLAVEFVRSGWDVKALVRLMVTSATFRQSSRTTPAAIERDPENRLLARGSRYRMPSWMLRDVALAASGLLVDRRGGPSVKPYQPEGIWEEATFGKKTYVQDHGEALYRRTLYVFWRRIVGPTMIFDNAPRQTCTVKTFRTNTPLHALTTLNDITYVEAARALAQRALLGCDDPAERLRRMFRWVLAREPSAAEASLLAKRVDTLEWHYSAHPDEARELLSNGESPRDPTLDLAEHAAWAGVASLVLNLDEALSIE